MVKQSHFVNKSQGFFLPLVLIMSIIILLIITTTVKIYRSELNITKNLIQQLEVDTIIQMGLEKFKDDSSNIEQTKGIITYSLPKEYNVNIQYHFVEENVVKLDYDIELQSNESYQITQFVPLSIKPH